MCIRDRLKQRTRELVSLEGIGQSLITWSDLRELGDRVLKSAMELLSLIHI